MSHESSHPNPFELEHQEKTEAEKRIANIKTFLLSNDDYRTKIYDSMTDKPSIQRILKAFGENEKTKNFAINEFFSQQQAGFSIPRGDHTYSITWGSSYPHLGQSVDITKRPTSYDQPFSREQISLSTYKYPRIKYEQNEGGERREKRGKEAVGYIDTFMAKFLITPSPEQV